MLQCSTPSDMSEVNTDATTSVHVVGLMGCSTVCWSWWAAAAAVGRCSQRWLWPLRCSTGTSSTLSRCGASGLRGLPWRCAGEGLSRAQHVTSHDSMLQPLDIVDMESCAPVPSPSLHSAQCVKCCWHRGRSEHVVLCCSCWSSAACCSATLCACLARVSTR